MAESGNSTSLGELNGTYFELWSFSQSECIIWMIVLCTVSVSIVTLNGLSVIVFLRERSFRSWFPVGNLATILAGLAAFFALSSLANLAAISLERFHATFRPFNHRFMKKRTFGAGIVAVWFSVGILLVVDFLILSYGVQLPFEFHMYSFLFCCLLIIIVSCASIAANINCKRPLRCHCGVRRDRKLTKTLFIVTGVSLMLSLPNIILKFVAGSADSIPYGGFHRITVHLSLLVHCLFYFSSLVNPIFYAFRIPENKRALSSALMCSYRPIVGPSC